MSSLMVLVTDVGHLVCVDILCAPAVLVCNASTQRHV